MKVLVIEDQLIAAMQLIGTLRLLGHEVEHQKTAEAAWERQIETGYRLIVCDWRMPGMNGLDFCRKLRAYGGDYVYFILVSTTKITKESRDEALAAGVDDFLAKPVDPDELGMRLYVAQRILGFTTQVKRLESFLPMCGYCKKIRNDKEYWQEVETYFHEREGPRFSHGICPDCYQKVLAEFAGKHPSDAEILPRV